MSPERLLAPICLVLQPARRRVTRRPRPRRPAARKPAAGLLLPTCPWRGCQLSPAGHGLTTEAPKIGKARPKKRPRSTVPATSRRPQGDRRYSRRAGSDPSRAGKRMSSQSAPRPLPPRNKRDICRLSPQTARRMLQTHRHDRPASQSCVARRPLKVEPGVLFAEPVALCHCFSLRRTNPSQQRTRPACNQGTIVRQAA